MNTQDDKEIRRKIASRIKKDLKDFRKIPGYLRLLISEISSAASYGAVKAIFESDRERGFIMPKKKQKKKPEKKSVKK